MKEFTNAAIFAKNHVSYLEDATQMGQKKRNRPITLRAQTRWKTAEDILLNLKGQPLPIYFAPIDGDGFVQYEAKLVDIQLNPKSHQKRTKELLRKQCPGTEGEGLWQGKVKTLYVITDCQRIKFPYHMSLLTKLSDNKKIDENFNYSYALVRKFNPPKRDNVDLHPEEIEYPAKYIEGACKSISVNAYERSAAARRHCLRHYGYDCSVCGMNFKRIYGDIRKEFIHVHHLLSLAQVGKEYHINPIEDIRPICPNCHAMIHLRKPPYSIKELKRKLTKR